MVGVSWFEMLFRSGFGNVSRSTMVSHLVVGVVRLGMFVQIDVRDILAVVDCGKMKVGGLNWHKFLTQIDLKWSVHVSKNGIISGGRCGTVWDVYSNRCSCSQNPGRRLWQNESRVA